MNRRKYRLAAAFAAAIMIFPVSAAGVQASEPDPAQARASVTPDAELPEDYIREALADPSVETVRVTVLKSADTVPQDILNTLGEKDKIKRSQWRSMRMRRTSIRSMSGSLTGSWDLTM